MSDSFEESAIWFYEVWKLGQQYSRMNDAGFLEYMIIRDKADRDFELEIRKTTNQCNRRTTQCSLCKGTGIMPGVHDIDEFYEE